MSQLPFSPSNPAATLVVPVSGISGWMSVVNQAPGTAGNMGLSATDPLTAQGIVRRAAQVTDASRITFRRSTLSGASLATSIRLRLCYPYSTDPEFNPTSVQVRLFGGPTGDRNLMAPLRNGQGDVSVRITPDSLRDPLLALQLGSDPLQEYAVSVPDNVAHTWDCDGCEYFVVAIEKAFTDAVVLPRKAFIEAKAI